LLNTTQGKTRHFKSRLFYYWELLLFLYILKTGVILIIEFFIVNITILLIIHLFVCIISVICVSLIFFSHFLILQSPTQICLLSLHDFIYLVIYVLEQTLVVNLLGSAVTNSEGLFELLVYTRFSVLCSSLLANQLVREEPLK